MPKEKKKSRILGIDPGTQVMGYAFIEARGSDFKIDSVGIVRLDQYKDHYERLEMIASKLNTLIERYQPEEMGIEAPFFGKNVQSMLKLGRAQGVAIATAMLKKVAVTEYSPRKIKQAITGNGNSSKEQVAEMIKRICKMDSLPRYHDATDALAVAVCHSMQNKTGAGEKKQYTGWAAFAKDNEKRVR
ncbi:crossover junction endodeoxyribonuclease RuvC [Chitinophagales bacterium]|nr:crossover junction endodeoxyribonuclease RuvC [Chitinophagales bacterium]